MAAFFMVDVYQCFDFSLNDITVWYNSQRMHLYLNYQSPNEFERMGKPLKEVA
ncbi:IS3 family transposase [Shewanella frigidimarina]|uniref:IS3 family transposase n=1 Tax=Shewanella frigidimarina TaxID=56812 RepID=UPI001404D52F|nr:IS3 family transposase [Shewanella frigidimarina]